MEGRRSAMAKRLLVAAPLCIVGLLAALALIQSGGDTSFSRDGVVSLLAKATASATGAASPSAKTAKAGAAAAKPENQAQLQAEEKKHVMACAKKITGDDTPRKLAPEVRKKVLECAGLFMPPVKTAELLKESQEKLMAAAKTPQEKEDAKKVISNMGKGEAPGDVNGWAKQAPQKSKLAASAPKAAASSKEAAPADVAKGTAGAGEASTAKAATAAGAGGGGAAEKKAHQAQLKGEEKKHVMACAKKITGDDTPRKLAPEVRKKVLECAGLFMPPVKTAELLKESQEKLMAAAKTPQEKDDAKKVISAMSNGEAPGDVNGWAKKGTTKTQLSSGKGGAGKEEDRTAGTHEGAGGH